MKISDAVTTMINGIIQEFTLVEKDKRVIEKSLEKYGKRILNMLEENKSPYDVFGRRDLLSISKRHKGLDLLILKRTIVQRYLELFGIKSTCKNENGVASDFLDSSSRDLINSLSKVEPIIYLAASEDDRVEKTVSVWCDKYAKMVSVFKWTIESELIAVRVSEEKETAHQKIIDNFNLTRSAELEKLKQEELERYRYASENDEDLPDPESIEVEVVEYERENEALVVSIISSNEESEIRRRFDHSQAKLIIEVPKKERPKSLLKSEVKIMDIFDKVLNKEFSDSIILINDLYDVLDKNKMAAPIPPELTRSIKKTYNMIRRLGDDRKVILVGPPIAIPDVLSNEVLYIELGVPSALDVTEIIEEYWELYFHKFNSQKHEEGEIKHKLIDSLLGLSEKKIRCVLDNLFDSGVVDIEDIRQISDEKSKLIRSSGVLELVSRGQLPEFVTGGAEDLMEWLNKQLKVFSDFENARRYGLIERPKGVMLVGIPGGGKSLTAKVVAKVWGYPLVRLDVGSIMQSLVGESESRMRQALKFSVDISPCILWIDELEKGFGRAFGNLTSDSINNNLLSTFLYWLQENKKPVFTIATVNNFGSLPPELTRAGRFDATFFMGCPGEKGRKDIINTHLMRYLPEYNITENQQNELIKISKGFTGAEIEQAIKSALVTRFSEDASITYQDLETGFSKQKPIVKSLSKELAHIWQKVDSGTMLLADENGTLNIEEMLELFDDREFFPSYCRKESISGMEYEKAKALMMLELSLENSQKLALFNVRGSEWIYGQGNFKVEQMDTGNIKFCQKFEDLEYDQQFTKLMDTFSEVILIFEDGELNNLFRTSPILSEYSVGSHVLEDDVKRYIAKHLTKLEKVRWSEANFKTL
ncbi:MAG: AAA family ATPase [Candidatus Thiodiazotropha sp.]